MDILKAAELFEKLAQQPSGGQEVTLPPQPVSAISTTEIKAVADSLIKSYAQTVDPNIRWRSNAALMQDGSTYRVVLEIYSYLVDPDTAKQQLTEALNLRWPDGIFDVEVYRA